MPNPSTASRIQLKKVKLGKEDKVGRQALAPLGFSATLGFFDLSPRVEAAGENFHPLLPSGFFNHRRHRVLPRGIGMVKSKPYAGVSDVLDELRTFVRPGEIVLQAGGLESLDLPHLLSARQL